MRRIAQLARPAAGALPETPIATGFIVGRIVALGSDGSLAVCSAELPGEVPARLAVPATEAQIRAAIESSQEVVLACERGLCALPIVVGFIQKPVTAPPPALRPPASGAEPSRVVEADVDGRRVRIVGHDEIVLQCGEASITLRRNGRVMVRGTYVETHSEGTNRIKGGQVRIN
jgi:hypothetical protein